MSSDPAARRGQVSSHRGSARARLALSYAIFLVAAGAIVLAGVYVVLRTVPNYPLTPANPSDVPYAPSRQEILDLLLSTSAYILVALAVIGLVGGWLLAGWILRPLRDLNEAALRAADGDLTHRVRLSGRNDEFRRLADTFDDMLERLHRAFVAQERFAANASHELRTPLAVTATMLEVARRDPDHDHAELLIRLTTTNDRAVGLTEALLRLADISAGGIDAVSVDLPTIAEVAIAEHRPEAERRGVDVVADLQAAATLGDEALLRQVAGNLIQNAIRHNRATAPRVGVSTRGGANGSVSLTVWNTGEQLTADAVSEYVEPFLRGAGRAVDRDAPTNERGYGLGLALVARIVDAHRGSLTMSPRDDGGLVVTVTLPVG